MLLARKFQERRIAIYADDMSIGPDGFCDSRGNRSCSTADVQYRQTRTQQCREIAMVPFKSAPPQNARIGAVALSSHIRFPSTTRAGHRQPASHAAVKGDETKDAKPCSRKYAKFRVHFWMSCCVARSARQD